MFEAHRMFTLRKVRQFSNSHAQRVVARRALALSDEAISCYEETASAKNKSASQRHDLYCEKVTQSLEIF